MANLEPVPVLREKQERPRRSRKLLALLFLLFTILFAILFLRSSISKISALEITGNRYLTVDEIKAVLKVEVGDQFFGTSSATMEQRISQLTAVDHVEVSKQFPGYIAIHIQERQTVAYRISPEDGKIVAVLANGSSIIPNMNGFMINRPVLTGWDNRERLLDKLVRALATIDAGSLAQISEIRPTPSEAYPDKITMYTRADFEVVTTITHLPDKVQYLNSILDVQEPGTITMLEADTYVPYVKNQEKDTTQSSE